MKKLIVLCSVFVLVISMSGILASAETTSLLPDDDTVWQGLQYVDANGNTEDINVKTQDGVTEFWGSTIGWPCAAYSAAEADWITVPVEGMSLQYDITIDVGRTNILLFMKGETPNSFTDKYFTISQTDDDVAAGTYSGTLSLEDITTNEFFPASALNDDGTLTISGLKIFSVAGATVTVNKLVIVSDSEVNTSQDESSVVSEESLTGTTSFVDEDSDVSAAESENDASDINEEEPGENDNTIWYIVGGIGVVALIAVIVVAMKKKK